MAQRQEAQQAGRPEDELFPAGSSRPTVTVVLGGIPKRMLELPARANEEWKRELAEQVATRSASLRTLDSTAAIAALFSGVTDVQAELIAAYDREGRMGGKDWILDNATASEIWTAFKGVLFAAFPFLSDAARAPNLVAELLPQLVALLGNQPSPSGDGTSAS